MSKVKATATNKPIVLDVPTFRLKVNEAYFSSVMRVMTARLRCGVSFHITVDRLGWFCYTHLFLSILLSHLNISYIIWNGHERHIQIFCCTL